MVEEKTLNPPTIDPDCVAETVCIGKFNIVVNGPIVTLTFTHARPRIGLLDDEPVTFDSVVRARIVTSTDNLVALRNVLNRIMPDNDGVLSDVSTSGGGTKH
jgi:hypothetical protein